jgi:flagellar biosynthesis protein FlhG
MAGGSSDEGRNGVSGWAADEGAVDLGRPARRAKAGHILAIASGKGGVGKTWLAITLAHCLARAGQRVLLFDGDLGLANVDIQLGLTPRADLSAVLAGTASLADVAEPFTAGGFAVAAGRSGSGSLAGLDPAALDRVLAQVRAATEHYDVVLLDLGAGIERGVRRMAAFADELLVVATEEPTSITDAYAVLKLHAQDGGTQHRGMEAARVVVNQCSSGPAGQRVFDTLARACRAFLGSEPALAGMIRRDDRVRDAIRRQTLLLQRHPASTAGEDVETLSRRIIREKIKT